MQKFNLGTTIKAQSIISGVFERSDTQYFNKKMDTNLAHFSYIEIVTKLLKELPLTNMHNLLKL